MAFELPALPYSHDALEPHIDTMTMQVHHGKHHAGYTANLNKALEPYPELAGKTIEELLGNLSALPSAIQKAVRNNGGGFYNHCLFWEVMSPNGGGAPSGALGAAIDEAFGSFDAFKEKMNTAGATQFGSGWAWLSVDKSGKLVVESTANQDSPISEGRTPILGVDVWEHAYYLHYQNRRADYLSAFWNVVNWEQVARNFETAKA
jgi:Fe-Mn family superoxide dismutase